MAGTRDVLPNLLPAERRVGLVLDGKWKLERLLGVGAMAAVYAARHRNGTTAAIKLFPLNVTTDEEVAARLLKESTLANKIGHPAVVKVLDEHFDPDREIAYLVMELLEGESLEQRLRRSGPLPAAEAVEWMIELCSCLEAAHSKSVIHRDIKPENLFVSGARLRVLDFGLARAQDSEVGITRTGSALGTPAYMPPEQALGRTREIGPHSDVYAVGATLLRLVTGLTLHEAQSAQEMLVRAAWTPAPRAQTRCPTLRPELARVIDRACEYEAAHRYASAALLKADLERVAAVLAGAAPAAQRAAPEAGAQHTPLPRSLVLTMVAVFTLLVVGVASGLERWSAGAPLPRAASVPKRAAPTGEPTADARASTSRAGDPSAVELGRHPAPSSP